MHETLGVRLRLQRERQQVSLATIAERTKIKMSLLDELERDDTSHWPSGIFRRSFVRAYAQAIGLDPDPVVREFLEWHPDPEENLSIVGAAMTEAGAQALKHGRPPTRLGCLLQSAVAAVASRRTASRVETHTIAPPSERFAFGPEPSAPVPEPVVPAPEPFASMPEPPAPVAFAESPIPLAELPASMRAEAPVVLLEAQSRPPDLSAVAHLCSRLARVLDTVELPPLLAEAAAILDAVGVIVWVWEPMLAALTPMLSHGYSDTVLAQIPKVRRDADNAIADAFRSGETRTVCGDDQVTGAIVVPLMAPARCIGVLALESRRGAEQREPVRALATIIAAQLVTLVGPVPLAEAVNA